MELPGFVSFLIASIALLGSPGPAIAALVSLGQRTGWRGGLPFLIGLELGLSIVAAICAFGIFALFNSFPKALPTLSLVAIPYLLFIAYKIATAPIANSNEAVSVSSTFIEGFLLGMTNPKTYLAFVSLFASFRLFPDNVFTDNAIKWVIIVIVTVAVDFAWLYAGIRLGRLSLSPFLQRTLNVGLAAAVVIAAAIVFRDFLLHY